jgi:hypothetical protein
MLRVFLQSGDHILLISHGLLLDRKPNRLGIGDYARQLPPQLGSVIAAPEAEAGRLPMLSVAGSSRIRRRSTAWRASARFHESHAEVWQYTTLSPHQPPSQSNRAQ